MPRFLKGSAVGSKGFSRGSTGPKGGCLNNHILFVMEAVIVFLFLLLTLIVPAVVAARKKSGDNKASQQSFDNISNGFSNDWERAGGTEWVDEEQAEEVNEGLADQKEELKGEFLWEQRQREGESLKEEIKLKEQGEQEKEEPKERKQEEKPAAAGTGEASPLREAGKTVPKEKDKIQRIKEQFDLTEAILYSEIINKLDQLGIISASYADVEGRGRSRELALEYEADAVLDRL